MVSALSTAIIRLIPNGHYRCRHPARTEWTRLPTLRRGRPGELRVACLVRVLVGRGALDGQQEGAEVFAHLPDRVRPGPAEQPFLGSGPDGHDLVRALLAGLGEGDEDLPAVSGIDVAPSPPVALQPGHPVGDRAGGHLGPAQQRAGAEAPPGSAPQRSTPAGRGRR